MIARVAAMDTPTTQIPATKIRSPAGRCRPGGPGSAAPTATGSTPGTPAPGATPVSASAEGAAPPAGAGAAGSTAATPGIGPALDVALASGDRPPSCSDRSAADPALPGLDGDLVVRRDVAAVRTIDHQVRRLAEVVHEGHGRTGPYRHRAGIRLGGRAHAEQSAATVERHGRRCR